MLPKTSSLEPNRATVSVANRFADWTRADERETMEFPPELTDSDDEDDQAPLEESTKGFRGRHTHSLRRSSAGASGSRKSLYSNLGERSSVDEVTSIDD